MSNARIRLIRIFIVSFLLVVNLIWLIYIFSPFWLHDSFIRFGSGPKTPNKNNTFLKKKKSIYKQSSPLRENGSTQHWESGRRMIDWEGEQDWESGKEAWITLKIFGIMHKIPFFIYSGQTRTHTDTNKPLHSALMRTHNLWAHKFRCFLFSLNNMQNKPYQSYNNSKKKQ